MTAQTIEYPFRKRHLLSMSTCAACLTRVGGIDFDSCSSSFFRFGEHLSKECRPRGICNAFGKTVVLGHAVDLQVFDADDPIGIDNVSTFLMGEVLPSESDPFMHPRDSLAMFAPFRGSFCKLAVFALHLSELLFLFAEKAGVGNLFPSRERGKGGESDVNP